MPYDSNGNFSLNTGYLAVSGQVIQPSQHNPPLEDIAASGLSQVLVRDGRAPMTGTLNMNGFKISNLLNGTSPQDAVSKAQLDVIQPGYIFGLSVGANVTDPSNDIDVLVGAAAEDSASAVVMKLTSNITKRIDAGWAVGSGNGGLDTGAVADGTYYVWLIQRPDTSVVDVLISLSATSPTMPTNYTRKQIIGKIVRSSGINRGVWSLITDREKSGVRELFNAYDTAPLFACRAWVKFNGTGTVAIGGSGNVSSITDNGTGDYTVNFVIAMPSINYSAALTCNTVNNGAQGMPVVTISQGSFRFTTQVPVTGAIDPSFVTAAFFC